MPSIPPSATGSHNRVRMKRADQAVTINGTMLRYDPKSGDFDLLMDYQPAGATSIAFHRVKDSSDKYKDPDGLDWICLG
jgi:hypothetical protein